ncbi:MAG: DoxX family protein [Actinomycetota bacterium]|nr:DoxX family protein [Actinomycetota bacterium]
MKKWTTIGLQVLLGLAFLASAISKLTGATDAMREHLGIAPWLWVLTALVEIVGAAGMCWPASDSRGWPHRRACG